MRFPVPSDLHGDSLADELAAAGFDAIVSVDRDELVIDGPSAADRDAVQQVVDAHTPPPLPPDPDDELDAGLAEVAARDDVPEWGQALLAQLRGQGGHAGRAAGRRPE